jgi:hypothetical protein
MNVKAGACLTFCILVSNSYTFHNHGEKGGDE